MISKAPPFLSARVAGNIEASSSMDRLIRVMENLYDPVENPTGVINLSVAENVSMGVSPNPITSLQLTVCSCVGAHVH